MRVQKGHQGGLEVSKGKPIALEQSLPPVPVPLLAGDPDATLDLQTAFARAYDVCGLDSAIDYCEPPDIPLPADKTAWAEARLRDAGLRS